MKTFYVAIAMIILALLIPPDNKPDLNCYNNSKIKQEKLQFIFSDIKCFKDNIKLNIDTRINNLWQNSDTIDSHIWSLKNLNNIQSDFKKNSSLDWLDTDFLNELNINSSSLDEKLSNEEYQNFLNEIN